MIASASDCGVCGAALGAPIYRSAGAHALSSLCELHRGACQVSFCRHCGHLQSNELPDLERYYDEQYRILDASEDEDQLYAVESGRPVFRAEHQAHTFLSQVGEAASLVGRELLPRGSRLLDFGCAKGATSRHLAALRPDLDLHLFDVSDRYLSFWSRFAAPRQWATHALPTQWTGAFDALMTFFVLEHVSDLASSLAAMRSLLKPDGLFHAVVPNPLANRADFVVVDHVHHFSGLSLRAALARNGFALLGVDASAHESAWTVTALRSEAPSEYHAPPHEAADLEREVQTIAAYWSGVEQRVRAFEGRHAGPRAAVYGAGFYGSLIASLLDRPENVACFVDRNPHLHGRLRWHAPIVAPEQLDPSIRHVYVGLNPRVARDGIASVAAFRDRSHEYFFL